MNLKTNPPKFALLAVLDGWGLAAASPGNAIAHAQLPNMNSFWASYPHCELLASGDSVGLPHGEDGNTETGHLNLGAGRIVYQDLERINISIADGSFYQNQQLLAAIAHAKQNNSDLHLMGLIGSGGVHSNIEHLFALIDLVQKNNFNRLFLHLFTDGRDSPPTSAKIYMARVREVTEKKGIGAIASISGRYYAMDRDLRWDRTSKTYCALVKGQCPKVRTPEEAIDASYAEGKTDEFIEPSIVTSPDGNPVALIKDNDAVIFFNFRIDRPRQLALSFLLTDFSRANASWGYDPYSVKYKKTHLQGTPAIVQSPFDRGPKLKNLFFVTMTEYSKSIVEAGACVAFPPQIVEMPLGRIISEHGFKQLRASESEKERFVTFYFNGQLEIAFSGEERLTIPSPKIATYDLKPEMSARELTEAVLSRLREDGEYKFVLLNFANVDMVGHTGNIGAATKACEVVDECIGKLASWALAYDGLLLITADHGNSEEMIDSQTGQIETEHSTNPVPFIAVSKNLLGKSITLPSGILADVAPTILSALNLQVPTSMTGRNLLTGVL